MSTKKPRRKELFTDFALWINSRKSLDSKKEKIDVQNIDFVIHKYGNNTTHQLVYLDDMTRKIMLVEEKCKMQKQDFAQKDTHMIIDHCLHQCHGKRIPTFRGERILQYFGYYVVTFSETCPESGKTFINYREVSAEYLEEFLGFKRPIEEYECFFHRS